MKQSVFSKIKDAVLVRWTVLKASTIYTFQQDTAYVFENWAGVLSTAFYTISFIVFIKVLYSNVGSVAGYSEAEMLFFVFMGQVVFYIQTTLFEGNIVRLSDFVNSGELDLILVKPLPSLFYITFKRISLLFMLRDGIPALLIVTFLVDWNSLDITLLSGFAAAIILVIGLFLNYCLSLFATLPVFWIGKNSEIYILSITLQWVAHRELPFEGFPTSLKLILSSIFPVLICGGLATSVALNKSEPLPMLLFALSVGIIFSFLKRILWNASLRAYSSASS